MFLILYWLFLCINGYKYANNEWMGGCIKNTLNGK